MLVIEFFDLRMDVPVNLIVVIGRELKPPTIELKIVQYHLQVCPTLPDAGEEGMVACPCVVGEALGEGDAVERHVVPNKVSLGLVWILCHDEERLTLGYLTGYLAETINGISKHWCPVRVLVRPR